jgi:hypothetical protein
MKPAANQILSASGQSGSIFSTIVFIKLKRMKLENLNFYRKKA